MQRLGITDIVVVGVPKKERPLPLLLEPNGQRGKFFILGKDGLDLHRRRNREIVGIRVALILKV